MPSTLSPLGWKRLLNSLVVILTFSLLAGCSLMLGKPPPPVTVPEIIQMSNAKVPPATIIEKMRDSGTVYRLQASQLAELKKEGVPDQVLNFMQQTYLDAVRRDQSREDFDRWVPLDYGFLYGGPMWW